MLGLTQGAQPIISFNYGTRNKDRAKKSFSLFLKSSLIYSTIVWAMVMLFPQVFIGAFTSNINLVNLTIPSIRIFMAVSLVFGI